MSAFVINSYAFGAAFTPAALSPDVWLDASDTSTITSAGSPALVSEWRDKSGNSRHFEQTTSANRPTTSAATQNSLNLLSFSGSQSLVGPTTPNLDAAPYEVFVAGNPTANGTYFSQTNNGTASLRQAQLFSDFNALQAYVRGFQNVFSAVFGFNRFRVVAINRTSSSPVLRDNNSTLALNAGTAAAETTAPLRVGARGPGVSFPFNGTIGEVVLVTRDLTTAERTDLLNYFASKWNFTL